MPEDQVVSPPLASIPATRRRSGAGRADGAQTLVLKDGRKIPVTRLARRGGQVLFADDDGRELLGRRRPGRLAAARERSRALDAPAGAARPPPAPRAARAAPAPRGPGAAPVAPRPAPRRPPASGEPRLRRRARPLVDRLPRGPALRQGAASSIPTTRTSSRATSRSSATRSSSSSRASLDVPSRARRLPVRQRREHGDPGEPASSSAAATSLHDAAGASSRPSSSRARPRSSPRPGRSRPPAPSTSTTCGRGAATSSTSTCARARRAGAQDFSLEEAFGEVKLADALAALRLRLGARRHPAVRLRLPRLRSSATSTSARASSATLANNRWQYNAAFFDLLEKDTNSELNTFEKREQKVCVANVFSQDFLTLGYTLSLSFHCSRDEASVALRRERLPGAARARSAASGPHEVKSHYLGLGRATATSAGSTSPTPSTRRSASDELNADRRRERSTSSAQMAAARALDRQGLAAPQGSALLRLGRRRRRRRQGARGFDSIYDNPTFAGGPFSFWNRSGIALTQTGRAAQGAGQPAAHLRTNKFEGQANFVNPGCCS